MILIAQVENYADQKKISINIENSEIAISALNLKTIIYEIIDNAFKFSSTNTEITISGKNYETAYKLTIENTGLLFKPEYINKIDAFVQFNRKKFAQQGSGLGLFIAKSLMELNNSTLTIKSYKDKTKVELKFLRVK